MRKNVSRSSRSIRLALLTLCSALAGLLLVTVRYILSTPQPLESEVPGEAGIYQWKHGHIFYKVSGDTAAPPLVIWHAPEIGGSSYEMRGIVAGLALHYRVYVPDLLGFGLSDHPQWAYSAKTYIELGQDFLRDVVGQPAVLLAAGRSCNYSVAIANETPDLCTRLILLSPTKLLHKERAGDYKYRFLFQNTFLGLVSYAICSRVFCLRRLIAHERQQSPHLVIQGELQMYRAVAHQLGARYAGLALLAGQLDFDVVTQLIVLQQPLLVLWGEQAIAQLGLSDLLVRAKIVEIAGASVKVQEERPVKVVDSILAWLVAEVEFPQDKVEASNSNNHLVAELAKIEVERDPVFVVTAVRDELELLTATGGVPGVPENSTEVSALVGDVELAVEEQADRENKVGSVVEEVGPDEKVEARDVSAYCVKCREKRSMKNARKITTKNGRRAMEGVCPVCGTKLFRFIAA